MPKERQHFPQLEIYKFTVMVGGKITFDGIVDVDYIRRYEPANLTAIKDSKKGRNRRVNSMVNLCSYFIKKTCLTSLDKELCKKGYVKHTVTPTMFKVGKKSNYTFIHPLETLKFVGAKAAGLYFGVNTSTIYGYVKKGTVAYKGKVYSVTSTK